MTKEVDMDPQVREEAHGRLSQLFRSIGESRQQGGVQQDILGGGLAGQLEEFMSMPLDLATIFLDMSVQLAELVLSSLEEAGMVLVKGLTPA